MENTPFISNPAFDDALVQRRNKPPTEALLGIISVLVLLGFFVNEFLAPDMAYGVFALAALVAAALVIFNPIAGLCFYLFAVGLSPEFELMGIKNLRAEDFVLMVLLISSGFRALQKRDHKQAFELRWPIGLLLFISLVSTLNNAVVESLNIVSSLLFLAKTSTYYFVCLLLYRVIEERRQVKALIIALALTGLVTGLVTMIYSPMTEIQDVSARIMGPPGETGNIFAAYLVFNLVIIVALFMESPTRWHRLLIIPSVFLLAIPSIFTFSRAGFVSLIVGFGVLGICFYRRMLIILAVFAFLFPIVMPAKLTERFSTIQSVVTDKPTSSWAAKLTMWERAFNNVLETPFMGKGVASTALGALDNEFVKQIHDLGVLGLLVFLWLLFLVFRQALRLVKRTTDPLYRGLAIGFIAGYATILVNAISAPTLTAIRTGELFFFTTGLIFAISRLTGTDVMTEHDEKTYRVLTDDEYYSVYPELSADP